MTREEAIAYIEEWLKDEYALNSRDRKVLNMVLKALKQKPCEDAISRERVCDYIAEFINHEYSTQAECEMVDAMIEGIQHLPSVTPQYTDAEIQKMQELEHAEIQKAYELGKALKQEPKTGHWIPVSERLPDKNVEVIVTTKWGICVAERLNDEYCGDDEGNSIRIDNIKAWMPLPEPYKIESEEI